MDAVPRIDAVSALPGYRLRICWKTGQVSTVDISDIIRDYKAFQRLRDDPDLFAQVRVGEYAYDVEWPDDMDMPCTVLWSRAQAQAA